MSMALARVLAPEIRVNSHGFWRLLPEPNVLTPAETKRVAGGSVHKNDNSGPGSASYNTPGNPDYGKSGPHRAPVVVTIRNDSHSVLSQRRTPKC